MGAIFDWNQTGFDGSGTIKAKGTEIERNPWYLGTGHQPDHKVDAVAPSVSSLSITSGPANGDSYSAGELVRVEVVFSERVTTSGRPRMELSVGGEARQATLLPASEGTYGTSLVFEYEVQENDEDTDGIGIDANVLQPNGGGIHDSAGNAAGLSHDTVSADPNQMVDTSS